MSNEVKDDIPLLPLPVGTTYTMEALVPRGSVKTHAMMHVSLPAGTALYTADQLRDYARAQQPVRHDEG